LPKCFTVATWSSDTWYVLLRSYSKAFRPSEKCVLCERSVLRLWCQTWRWRWLCWGRKSKEGFSTCLIWCYRWPKIGYFDCFAVVPLISNSYCLHTMLPCNLRSIDHTLETDVHLWSILSQRRPWNVSICRPKHSYTMFLVTWSVKISSKLEQAREKSKEENVGKVT
jgi:hypothetical protein